MWSAGEVSGMPETAVYICLSQGRPEAAQHKIHLSEGMVVIGEIRTNLLFNDNELNF